MGLMVSDKGGGNFEPVDAGVHQAVCYAVLDIGTQHNVKWNQYQRKVIIIWELPLLRIQVEDEGQQIDKPKVISRVFTASLSEKSHLRPFLESWRGKPFSADELLGFDMANLVGVNCMLNIIHKQVEDKTYANVTTAMPLMQDMTKLHPENETIYFSIDDHGLKFPESAPEWIRKKFFDSQEYGELGGGDYVPESLMEEPPMPGDDDLPF